MVTHTWVTGESLYSADLNDSFTDKNTTFTTEYGTGTTDGTLNVPIGTIIPWVKDLTGTPSLPTGWLECDGTNGTPNLTDFRFLRGVSGATGGTGGAVSHTHTPTNNSFGGSSTAFFNSTSWVSHEPAYYTVIWIIKVGV